MTTDGLTWILWSVAGFVALSTLVRFMLALRNRLYVEIRDQIAAQHAKPADSEDAEPGKGRKAA